MKSSILKKTRKIADAEIEDTAMPESRAGLLAAASNLPPVVSIPPASKTGADGSVDSEA